MNYLLGAELNGNQLKIAAAKKSGNTLDIVKLDTLILPNDEGETLSLLGIWKEKNLPDAGNVRMLLAVSESVLHLKEVEMPKLDRHQITEAIYWEIPSIAPISQTEAVYDWKIIEEGADELKVLAIIGKSAYVENIISTFSKAGIEIQAIEPSSAAISRITDADFSKNTLVCFAEEKEIDYMILRNGLSVFTATGSSRGQVNKTTQIRNEKDLLEDISSGSKKVISYWETKEADKIGQIILIGDLVQKYFGTSAEVKLSEPLPVIVGKAIKHGKLSVGNYKNIDLARYLAAAGAGVRFTQNDVFDGINLFPPAEKKKIEAVRRQKKTRMQFLGFVYANTFLLVLIVASIFTLGSWRFSLENELEELNTLSSQHPANELIKEVNETNRVINGALDLIENQEDAGDKLRLITRTVPQDIKLESIAIASSETNAWEIEGTGDRTSVLAFYENISKNVTHRELNMPYGSLDSEKDNQFLIEIIW